MTTKLTLTIEDSVIGSAKKYALKQGKSLSGIVETYLISITSENTGEDEISPDIRKLMGVISTPKNFNYKKALGKALSAKYLK